MRQDNNYLQRKTPAHGNHARVRPSYGDHRTDAIHGLSRGTITRDGIRAVRFGSRV